MKTVNEMRSMRRALTNMSRSQDLGSTERAEVERIAGQVDELASLIFRATG